MRDEPYPFPYGYYNELKPRGVDTRGNTIMAKEVNTILFSSNKKK